MRIIIAFKTCIFLAFPLVYTKLCFNNPSGSISDDSVYNKQYFCCDHYEMKDEECVECEIGFTSSKGRKCKPCSPHNFGYRCTETCISCKEYERCDPIHGCTSSLMTNVYSSQMTESLGISSIDQTSSHTNKPYEEKDVLNFPSRYAYIFGGCGVSGIIVLCTICYKIRSYKSKNVVITQVFVANSNAEANGIENVYEEIEEINLDESIEQPGINNTYSDEISSSASSTEKDNASISDDYLHPYQPMLQTVELHTYQSTSDASAVCTTERRDHVCVDICNSTDLNVEQTVCVEKTDYSKSLYLKYSDLEMDKGQDNSDLNRYENTRIFQTDIRTERRSTLQSTSSTEYAEIIHPAL